MVLEAINAEVPVLASNIAAHKNLLGKTYSAFHKNDDFFDLESKLFELITNEEKLYELENLIIQRKRLYQFDWDEEVCKLISQLFKFFVPSHKCQSRL